MNVSDQAVKAAHEAFWSCERWDVDDLRVMRAALEAAASTQPPSPQAEVQDCSGEISCRCPYCTCPTCGRSFEQSPAEPQGDVVEKVAKRIYAEFYPASGWEDGEITEALKDTYRQYARKLITDLTPLLPDPSYALEVRERLEGLPVYMAPTGTDENPQVFASLKKSDVLGALGGKDSE